MRRLRKLLDKYLHPEVEPDPRVEESMRAVDDAKADFDRIMDIAIRYGIFGLEVQRGLDRAVREANERLRRDRHYF